MNFIILSFFDLLQEGEELDQDSLHEKWGIKESPLLENDPRFPIHPMILIFNSRDDLERFIIGLDLIEEDLIIGRELSD